MADEEDYELSEEEGGGEGGGGKGKGMLIVIIVVAVVVILGGVGAFMFLGGDSGEEEGSAEEGGEGHGGGGHAESKASSAFGPLVEMAPIVANLNDPAGGRYIKATIRLEAEDGKAADEVNGALVPIRDRYLMHFSGVSVADTLGERNRMLIARDLKDMANEVVGKEAVRRIYFTEFVIQ